MEDHGLGHGLLSLLLVDEPCNYVIVQYSMGLRGSDP